MTGVLSALICLMTGSAVGDPPPSTLKVGKVHQVSGQVLLSPTIGLNSDRIRLRNESVGRVIMDGDKVLVGANSLLVVKQRNGIVQRFGPSPKWQVVSRKDSPDELKLREELERFTALVKPRGGKDGIAWPTDAPVSSSEFVLELEAPVKGSLTVQVLRADGSEVFLGTADGTRPFVDAKLRSALQAEQYRTGSPLRLLVTFGGRTVEHVLRLLPASRERAFRSECDRAALGLDEVRQDLMRRLAFARFGQRFTPWQS